jgi:hypothetical protein
MPQRFLRPGITNSDRWNKCSFEAQSLFIRLLTLVDDWGRFDGRIAILHSHCFALRSDIDAQRTAALRSEMQTNELIEVYQVEGKEYVQILQWKERVRANSRGEPTPSRWPDPPAVNPQDSAADRSDAPQNSASPALAIASTPSLASSPSAAGKLSGSVSSEPSNDPAAGVTISILGLAKKLICEKILGGKDPSRPWSYEAESGLSRLLPLPIAEIDDIAWFRMLDKTDDIPELKARRDPITETTLISYWGDELHRAREYKKKCGPRLNGHAKKEPPQWKAFFRWKYSADVVLPLSFWDLQADQKKEWHREHEEFERSRTEEPAAA